MKNASKGEGGIAVPTFLFRSKGEACEMPAPDRLFFFFAAGFLPFFFFFVNSVDLLVLPSCRRQIKRARVREILMPCLFRLLRSFFLSPPPPLRARLGLFFFIGALSNPTRGIPIHACYGCVYSGWLFFQGLAVEVESILMGVVFLYVVW